MHGSFPFRRRHYHQIATVFLGLLTELAGCAELLVSQFISMNMVTSQNMSWCFSHRQCAQGTFCAPMGLLDDYSKWLTYGSCLPCTLCRCDSDSIDKRCPQDSCPAGEVSGVRFLEGSFYNGLALPDGKVCVTIFVFEGFTFRQMSFSIDLALYASATGDRVDGSVLHERSQCNEVHAGLKAGIFEIDAGNKVRLTYTSGYDFQRSPIVLSAVMKNDCPNILMVLDRSSIPLFLEVDPSWTPPSGSMRPFELVQPPSPVCGDFQGFCLRFSNLEARSQAELRLHRMSPLANQRQPFRVFRGDLAKDAWRPDVASEYFFSANGSLCTIVVEQPALADRVVYFRTHIYGCSPRKTTLKNASISTARRSSQAFTASFTLKSTTSTGTTRATVLPSTSTSLPLSNRSNLTTSSMAMSTTTVTRACSGYGDLNLSSGDAFDSAYVLDCPAGRINLLYYTSNLKKFWAIGLKGPIKIWFSTILGIGTNGDYIGITSSSLPASFISGVNSDPTLDVNLKLKKCLLRPTCTQDAEIFTKESFNQTFDGPISLSFISQVNPGGAGVVLEYCLLSSPGCRALTGRRMKTRSLATMLGVSRQSLAWPYKVQSRPPELSLWLFRRSSNETGEVEEIPLTPTLCKCSAAPNISCASIFFQDPACVPALATWPWLGFHRATPLKFGNFSIGVDAIVYFERFQNLNANKNLYVTASFEIYTPTLPHHLDVLALFKGEEDDRGACDVFRSFSSCTSRSPVTIPPTLQRQLCWAYTSALKNPWADPHIPDPKYQAFGGSVDFCGGVAESAGPGAYYLVLFSHRMQRVIAQVDYIQERDCTGISFPCNPAISGNTNRQYDQSGPLAVCPSMFFRGSDLICAPCSPGSFSSLPNSQTCFSCPSGYFLPRLNLNIDNCTRCPSNLTGLSTLVVSQCFVNNNSTNNTKDINASNVTTTFPFVTTAVAKFCGDGIIFYDSPTSGKGKQCDAGSQLQYSSLSTFVSIYDRVESIARVRTLMKDKYFMCNRQTCQLMSYWCGDGVVTSYGPIYDKTACTAIAGKLICDRAALLKTEANISIYYNEECDDGNTINGDGCSSMCSIEKNFRCTTSFGRYFCYQTCGNGLLDTDTGESCDDGNVVAGDGCNEDCQNECGYSCSNLDASHLSSCGTVCGDGVIAGLEECDPKAVTSTAKNPFSDGCNSFCRQKVGWLCSDATSGCSRNSTQAQTCVPICGDGLIFPPEQCDDSEWNFDDKACKSDCTVNRQDVCYGYSCMFPIPTSQTAFSASELISSMQMNQQGFSEGIFILRDVFSTSSTSFSRAFLFFPEQYTNVSKMYPSLLLTLENHAQLLDSTQLATFPFCSKTPTSIWSSETGKIIESWTLLANNVSCKYNIFPRPAGQNLQFPIIKLSFVNLELNQGALLEFESTQSTSSVSSQGKLRCKLSAPFTSKNLSGPLFLLAPVAVVISASAQKQAEHYNFSKTLELDLRYSTLGASDATTENVLCLSRCRCDYSCGQLCFAGQFRRKYENSLGAIGRRNIDLQSLPTIWNSASTQIFAMNSKSWSNPSAQTSALFPYDFSQYPGTSLVPILTSDELQISLVGVGGSWRGSCHYQYEDMPQPVLCNVLLHISKDTLIKHVWNCPLKGHSVGRFISFDRSSSSVIDSSFALTYYRKAKIVWTKGGPGDRSGAAIRCVFNAGNTDRFPPENAMQILFEGGTKTDLDVPRFMSGGVFQPEENCRAVTLASITDSTGLSRTPPLFQPEDVDRYLACNMSLSAAIEKLQKSSPDCFILVRALLMRDFWSPLNLNILVINSSYEYDPISRYVCSSPCRDLFLEEIRNSVNVCSAAWNRGWSEWGFGVRIFKLLVSAASALYWNTLLCATNHQAKSCAEVSLTALESFRATNCSSLLNQSLYLPRLVSYTNPCSKNCSAALQTYINNLGCCLATMGSAGTTWLDSLTNPSISVIRFDFGDRSNPFNTSFPDQHKDFVEITFDSNSGFGISASGIENVHGRKDVRTLDSLLNSSCKLCSLPFQNKGCCNSLKCVNGWKIYSGACYCVCDEGFQGSDCAFNGYFAEAQIVFQIPQSQFPGDIFSYCEEAKFYQAASFILSVDREDVDFQPFMVLGRRSDQPTSVLSLLRIRTFSCLDAARSTQKLSSMSDPGIIAIFNNRGLPTPFVKSVWTYCNGRKTTCGANTATLTSVSQQAVFLACTTANAGNGSVNNAYASFGDTGLSASWKVAVIAVSTVFGFCLLCNSVICYRRKIRRKLKTAYRTMKLNNNVLSWLGKKRNNSAGPMADMVFVKDSEQKEPTQFVILSHFQPQVFELEQLDNYIESGLGADRKARDLCEDGMKHFSSGGISHDLADYNLESPLLKSKPVAGRPLFVPPLNLSMIKPTQDAGLDPRIDSGNDRKIDSGRLSGRGVPGIGDLSRGRSARSHLLEDSMDSSSTDRRLDSNRSFGLVESARRLDSDRSQGLASGRQIRTDRKLDSQRSFGIVRSAHQLDSDRSYRLDSGRQVDADKILAADSRFGVDSAGQIDSDRSHRSGLREKMGQSKHLGPLEYAYLLDSDRSQRLDSGRQVNTDAKLDSLRSFGATSSPLGSDRSHLLGLGRQTDPYRLGGLGHRLPAESDPRQAQVHHNFSSTSSSQLGSPRLYEDNSGKPTGSSAVRIMMGDDADAVYSSQVTTPRWSAFT